MVDRAIARAQKRVESHNFDIRKHLLEYDDVMNRQREYVYKERNVILDNLDVRNQVFSFVKEVIESQIIENCDGNDPHRWSLETLREWIRSALGADIELDEQIFNRSGKAQLDLFNHVWESLHAVYMKKVESIGEENFNYVERRISLDVIDARWKEHLYTMDHLREGIWSTSYAERNPLVEYKLEGFRMFEAMVGVIKEQITEFLFRIQVEGPVNLAPTRRVQGQAQHDSVDSFSGNGSLSSGVRPMANKTGESGISISGGGASRKKKSRRRR